MSIRLHGDQRLVLVLRGQDHFVFTHLFGSIRGADDGYLATDAEPATRSLVIPARLKAGGQAPGNLTQDYLTGRLCDFHFRDPPVEVCRWAQGRAVCSV